MRYKIRRKLQRSANHKLERSCVLEETGWSRLSSLFWLKAMHGEQIVKVRLREVNRRI
jgi:hypothetical protein